MSFALDANVLLYASDEQSEGIRGNLVPDAHIAAILHQHGIRRIYTRDRDFRRFDFLDVKDPFLSTR